jgi:N4-(beta-N-acetylglucosaminyl)-L-asparaginase
VAVLEAKCRELGFAVRIILPSRFGTGLFSNVIISEFLIYSRMFNRRKFLHTSFLGTVAAVVARENGSEISKPQIKKLNGPLVISTWPFGQAANADAWRVLSAGGRAVDAVEAGVKVPEADPANHTVGGAGYPDRDGHVTLDACIMDEKGGCGSVMCLEHISHPISVARLVMERTPHVVLVGEGALQFAIENGFEKKELLTPESEKAWKNWLEKSKYEPVMNIEGQQGKKGSTALLEPVNRDNHDTIGMLAMDTHGNLSGACTTSGLAFKMHGRVGDSPIIGAGLFVDNEVGAATSTGLGEEVIRTVGSHLVVELMRQGMSPEQACRKAVERIVKQNQDRGKDLQNLQVGFLALNNKGEYGAYAIQKGFSYAVKNANEDRVYPGKSIYE